MIFGLQDELSERVGTIMKRTISLFLVILMSAVLTMTASAEFKRGSSGEDVKELQQRLTDLGYLDDVIDGQFGQKTEEALRAFQKKNGIEATGIATITVINSLFSDDAINSHGKSFTAEKSTESDDQLSNPVEEDMTETELEENDNYEDGYRVYPRTFTSYLKDYSISLPDTCYITFGTENGYPGTPCYVIGKVTKIYKPNEVVEGSPSVIIVENEKGSVGFWIYSAEWFTLQGLKEDDQDLFNMQTLKQEYESAMDSTMDYTLPEIGEEVKIYGIYDGYSQVMEMAALTFGQDEYVYSLAY